MKQEVTGIILAGGQSQRMGTNKSLMIWQGKTLIEHAIDIVKPLCTEIVISSNKKIYDFTGYETWPDEIPEQAPIIGIYSCLKRSRTNSNIILSCDMPLVRTELLVYLLSICNNYDATIPLHTNNRLEPLSGIYQKSIILKLQEFIFSHNYRLYECIQSSSHILVPITATLPFYNSNMFVNINTIEDFKRLNEFI